ncbi:DNA kinase/phosphatase Pnk1 [Batrachochytrium dendrobatidis]|nr:DNA kinase/phosphatase Pnk1 [Batrachochytrium dendrobatidis]KAK5672828.1 DNA kinase/phosphatase Pnk1 [Batrachochytrium dendrobatidis]
MPPKRPAKKTDQKLSAKKHSKQHSLDTFLSIEPQTTASTASLVQWKVLHNSLLIGVANSLTKEHLQKSYLAQHTKIAAFDFDGTLAGVNGSYVFPKHGDDWRWFCPSVPATLRLLHNLGYRIVIFSNQSGILDQPKTSKKGLNQTVVAKDAIFKGRVENVVKSLTETDTLHIPLTFIAATSKDFFRKPCPGMWHYYIQEVYTSDDLASLSDADLALSFYCGDAAGRTRSNWHSTLPHPKDHSDCDHKFALNIPLRFIVPEVLFSSKSSIALNECLESKTNDKLNDVLDKLESIAGFKPIPWPEFNPNLFTSLTDSSQTLAKVVETITNRVTFTPEMNPPFQSSVNLIICVGSPASGKSSFVTTYLTPLGITHINQDTLGTKNKCLKVLSEAIGSGKSVVVDNTNPDKTTRKAFIQAAKESAGTECMVHVIALYFDTEMELCRHNNAYRELRHFGHKWVFGNSDQKKSDHAHVPGMVFHMYAKAHQEPDHDEGFNEIFRVGFHPVFESEHDEKLWKLHYL